MRSRMGGGARIPAAHAPWPDTDQETAVSINTGRKRGGNQVQQADNRLIELERKSKGIDSRRLNREANYVSRRVAKGSHGWSVGTWIKRDAGNWSKATAAATFSAELVGMVLRVLDNNNVEVVFEGYVRPPSLSYTDNTRYYLSTSAGTATSTKPTAPIRALQLFVALDNKWMLILGPAARSDTASLALSDLLDVDSASLALAADGDLLTFDFASSKWKAASGGTTSLGTRAAISVVGRAANSAGVAADIAASTTGDVLYMGASSLQWGPLGTPSYGDASVTAAKLGVDVVLNALQDVSVTGAAGGDFLRFNGTAWVNYDLGPIVYEATTSSLALDGGAGGVDIKVLLANAAGSRFILSGAGSTGSIEFKLDGDTDLDTEIVARIRSTGSDNVSFFDQGTSSITTGDLVMEWGCDTTYAARYFRSRIPLQVRDDSGTGTKDLVVKSTATQIWTIGDTVGPSTWLTMLGTSGDSYGRRIKVGSDIDLGNGGWVLYADRSNGTLSSRLWIGGTDGTWYQSGNATIQTSGYTALAGTGTTGVYIGLATSEKIGFWGKLPVTKTTVADPAANTVTGTATGTDAAMVNALKVDVGSLRTTLLALCDALQACGLV